MNNIKIRTALTKNGVKYWELAKILGFSDATLSRKLRDELPDSEQDRICRLIEERTKNGGGKSGATSDNR